MQGAPGALFEGPLLGEVAEHLDAAEAAPEEGLTERVRPRVEAWAARRPHATGRLGLERSRRPEDKSVFQRDISEARSEAPKEIHHGKAAEPQCFVGSRALGLEYLRYSCIAC